MTPTQYDLLERAIVRGTRVAVRIRGAELVIVPLSLRARGGREMIETRQPTTGEPLDIPVDDVEALVAV